MRILNLAWWRVLVVVLLAAIVGWVAGAAVLPWHRIVEALSLLIFGIWTTPKTWSAVVVTVADLNLHIRDNLGILKTSIDDNGHLAYPTVQFKSATYTALITDDVIICTGTWTLSLPALSTTTNHPLVVKNVGTGVITIDANGSELIDGALTLPNEVQYLAYTLFPERTTPAWQII